jgi:hypothetical protein
MKTFLLTNSKTSKVGHPLSRLPVIVGHIFTEPAKSYEFTHREHSSTWPPVYLISCPFSHIWCYAFVYNSNLSMLSTPKSCLFIVSSRTQKVPTH